MSIINNFKLLFKKKITLNTIVTMLLGLISIILLILYFINNNFRLISLISKYKFEFIFLFITGYFLYSLKYDILNIQLSFNSFIIYISNILLKEDKFKGIELVLFFILIYFLSHIILYIFSQKLSITKLESIFFRIFLWSILILVFNYFVNLLNINIKNLQFKDILLIPILFIIHGIIKSIFTLIEYKIQNKYFDILTHIIFIFLIDSFFLFFSIILGSVYNKIGIFNTSLFIFFLAFTILLIRYINNIHLKNYFFYSISSFINFKDFYRKNYSPFFPINENFDLTLNISENINFLTFIVFDIENFRNNIKDIDLNFFNKFRFFQYKNKFCSVLPSSHKINNEIIQMKNDFSSYFNSKVYCSFCYIKRLYWNYIDLSYLFNVLIKILNKNKKKIDILEIKQKYIVS